MSLISAKQQQLTAVLRIYWEYLDVVNAVRNLLKGESGIHTRGGDPISLETRRCRVTYSSPTTLSSVTDLASDENRLDHRCPHCERDFFYEDSNPFAEEVYHNGYLLDICVIGTCPHCDREFYMQDTLVNPQ
jgi:hypothetical protein